MRKNGYFDRGGEIKIEPIFHGETEDKVQGIRAECPFCHSLIELFSPKTHCLHLLGISGEGVEFEEKIRKILEMK